MKHTIWNRIFSMILVLAMLISLTPHIQAVDLGQTQKWKESNQSVSLDQSDRLAQLHLDDKFEDTDIVRVAIVLEEKSTIQAGFSTLDITSNVQAMAYDKNLKQQQLTVEERIAAQVLDGQELDVVWNLTLVGNIISANVPYGKIEAIAQVRGVAGVVLENMYQPAQVTREESLATHQFAATRMTGSNLVWTNGYTGAGSRIAVIDTGTDTDHQSFDNGAFLYALEQNALAAGLTLEEYVAGLQLLDEEELAEVLPTLNIYERENTLTAADLFLNEKLAFAVNYVDPGAGRLVVDHDSDYQSAHGSHVAGISTANRYIPSGDGYVDAMEEVLVSGVAPDAQLITMKVFGQNALRDSDYMAAVEDAILLGCDAVNLSLGTTVPGHAYNSYFAELLAYMAETDTVVVASAGNEGTWTETTVFGVPYSDDVTFNAVGAPGSYGNFFTVASVDNDGVVGMIFTAGDLSVMYVENTGYGNSPLASIDYTADGSGTTYEYVLIDGLGREEDYAGMDLTGKVVFCSRGETNFADKANIAVAKGAVAVVVYNNTDGAFGMNLSGYAYSAPVVSIMQSEANYIREHSTQQTTEGGLTYYTGQLDIFGVPQATMYNAEYYTMSPFSSWGVPGDLSIKPEITAPGGYIYSVYGSTPETFGTDQYEVMSGTSMAAPQVAGMVALLAQYMRENGLAETVGLSPRVLAQSLLMSTAIPLVEEGSQSYYPVIQQGAGLGRVDLATLASTYVMVAGQDDGKVKAELGDDPQRTGVYEFSFTIHNLTNEAQDYALSAELFRQGVYDPGEALGTPYGYTLQELTTVALDGNAVFTIDGVVVDDVATVPAGGNVTVQVQLSLTEEAKAELNAKFADGAFVQAYVFAEQVVEEGLQGTNHSIPVLAFYGNWTDPNMFDRGAYVEMMYGISDLVPYLYQVIGNGNALTIDYGDGREFYFGGNPLLQDDAYIADRNAFNSEDESYLLAQYFTLIRNAGDMRLQIVNQETGEVYFSQNTEQSVYSAFYNSAYRQWEGVQQGVNLFWTGTDANGQPLPEGTVVEVVLTAAPEYYLREDGTYDYDALGHGASLVTQMTIDNTAPELNDFALNLDSVPTLTVQAQDNEYIAAVVLLNKNGSIVLASGTPNQTDANAVVEMALDLTGVTGSTFQLAIYDYAMNVSVYEIELDLPEIERPYFTAVDYNEGVYYGFDEEGNLLTLAGSDRGSTIQAVEYVDGHVFEVTAGGYFFVADDSDLNSFQYIGPLDPHGEWAITNFLDLAYNYADEKLYGLFYSELNGEFTPLLCTIDMYTGEMDVLVEMPTDVNNMAIDGEGNFYSVGYDTTQLYTYTPESAANGEMTYVGETGYYRTGSFNSMCWDHNTDKLYWAYPNTLLELNPETGEPTLLCYFYTNLFVGLHIRPTDLTREGLFDPVAEVWKLELDYTENRVMVGDKVQLTATARPWNTTDPTVSWSSADESIATVDNNGMVTGVSVGTTVITATSNLDPTMTASCTMEVITLEKTLNGLVWDPDGKIWWSEFEVGGLPNYIKLQDTPVEEYLASTAFTPDGTLYAATTDLSTGYLSSSLFTVDPETFELTKIGDSDYGYSDIAYAPNLRGGSIVGTYGDSLLVIDPTTGELYGANSYYQMFMYGLCAVAYAGSDQYQDYGFDTYIDWFFLIDTMGYVYLLGFLADDNGNLYYLDHPATNGGIFTIVNYTTDVIYFSSAHYDGEFLYWSVYSESKDVSTLFAIDTVGSRKAYNMGNFGQGVWPVGGLMELPVSEHAHVYGEWIEETPATCTEPGEERRYCECGEYESRVVEATGHSFVDGACEHCGELDPRPVVTVGSVTAQVGEEVTVDVTISATTLAGYGLKVIYDKEALEITAITKGADAGEGFFSGSKKTGKVTYATTYNEEMEGVLFTITFKVLTEGEHTVSLEIDSFGLDDQTTFEVRTADGVITAQVPHTCVFGEWEVYTPATCTENGEERRYCECGEYESRVIEATGHTFGEWEVYTPATCTENGEERRYCECGEYESRVIEATGHTFGEWEVYTPATCTEDGEERRYCECGEYESRVIDAHGHNYVDGVCEHCGEEDASNPPTGISALAMVLLTGMSAAAVVITAKKKEEE